MQDMLEEAMPDRPRRFSDPLATDPEALLTELEFTVAVDGSRTPEAAIRATRRRLWDHNDTVATMPRPEKPIETILFARVKSTASFENLEELLRPLGVALANPYCAAALNEELLDFGNSGEYPHSTYWRDAESHLRELSFHGHPDNRPPYGPGVTALDKTEDMKVSRAGYAWWVLVACVAVK